MGAEISLAELSFAKKADAYGVTTRTLRNWETRGVEVNEACPLDFPAKLLVWLEAHIKRDLNSEVRARIQEAADGDLPRYEREASAAPVVYAPLLPGIPMEEMDFAALLRVTRRRAGTVAARLEAEESSARPNPRLLNTMEKQFLALSNSMRQLEIAALEVLEKAGQYAKIEDMTTELSKIHGPLAAEIFSLFDRYAPRAEDKTRAEQRAIYRDEVNKMFGRLQKNKFAAGLTEPKDAA